jgi:hypothetical protein
MTVQDIIASLRREWSSPRRTSDSDPRSADFEVACYFEDSMQAELSNELPSDLRDFWKSCSGARLFEDRHYGQWGLVVLSPNAAAAATSEFKQRRARDFRVGDLVIGRFLGDSDLLMLRCDPTVPDFGHAIVVLPLDPRHDWEVVATTFAEFLGKYAAAEGNKFWE